MDGIDRKDCLLISLIGDAVDLFEVDDLGVNSAALSSPSSILEAN